MTTTQALCGQAGVDQLIRDAFGASATIIGQSDVGGGRGTFSDVIRVELVGPHDIPRTLVAKLPTTNVNRDAAARSGAYLREAVAYRDLLASSPIHPPTLFASIVVDETAAFALEDLTSHRRVDQMTGLGPDDALAVVDELRRFHQHWAARLAESGNPVERHGVRRASVVGFGLDSLHRGLTAVRERWTDVSAEQIAAFEKLLGNAPALVTAFAAAAEQTPTLCHGDPRADNLCFEVAGGRPRLYDWQQIAVQFGEADVAWLVATSLTPETRRRWADELLAHYQADQSRFRLGLVLPGLAALLLAQRAADHDQTRRFIQTSLQRIGTALIDYEVPAIRA